MMQINTPNNEFTVNMAKQVNDEGLANMNKLVKGIFHQATGGKYADAAKFAAGGIPLSTSG